MLVIHFSCYIQYYFKMVYMRPSSASNLREVEKSLIFNSSIISGFFLKISKKSLFFYHLYI